VARKTFIDHKRVIFNGNGYSEEWAKEAQKRGLPNLRTTPQALKELAKPKTLKLFEDMKVLNEHEVRARKAVFEEDYFKKVLIEAKTLRTMTSTQILPAAGRYATELGTTLSHLKEAKSGGRALSVLGATLENAYAGLGALDDIIHKAHKHHGETEAAAHFAETSILPALNNLRESLDKLETLVDAERWPLPTYHQMLFNQD
jgi:glutamine synthetase